MKKEGNTENTKLIGETYVKLVISGENVKFVQILRMMSEFALVVAITTL